MNIAFLFPGQGSQTVGMGKELRDAYRQIVEPYLQEANEILGFDIARLCFDGPEEELVRTENQQPAIFLISCLTLAVLRQEGLEPRAVAGHSLGEYSALVAAGSLSFADGLRLTRRRGEMMTEVATRSGGIMAAILGLPSGQVKDICRQASELGVVEPANYNSPNQTVVSGEEPAVERAMELARSAGARKVVQLNVSAPFHSSLMAPMAEEFVSVLVEFEIRDPSIPVIANVDAAPEHTAEEVRRNLIAQLAAPVRWTSSVDRLVGDGIDTVVEVGPGKVLSGLMRSIAPSVTAYPTNNAAALEKVREALVPGVTS